MVASLDKITKTKSRILRNSLSACFFEFFNL